MTSPESGASNSLERSLKLLEIIGQTPGGLSNKDISRKLRIATSSTSYILKRLEREGYVNRREDGRYEIGLKVLSLASGALRELGFHHSAAPVLHPLTHTTQLSSYVGVLECGRLLVVEQVESPEFIRPETDLGTEHPAYSTAMGKMLLARLPEAALDALLESGELTRRTPNTIVSKSRLKEELRQIQRAGFALSEQEEFVGVRALAAPIPEKDGSVYASVAVAGPATFPAWGNLRELIAMVQVAGHDIARNTWDRASRHSSKY
ncbi:MAG TPA: IclR family transcriptional regulator [Bryobacteraceae bacterium]|nr:IclR family transcriptional regulator [Bryobacteraceae bacterium]